MSASMAEVLAGHQVRLAYPWGCKCDGYTPHILCWRKGCGHSFAAHQAGMLAANGYGKLGIEGGIWTMTDAEFKNEMADAWDEGYEQAEEDHYATGFYCKRLRSNQYRRPE